VKGSVVGMAVIDTVVQGETERVRVTDTVLQLLTDFVNGWVVGIPDIEWLPDPLRVGKEEAGTVGMGGGEEVTVTERV